MTGQYITKEDLYSRFNKLDIEELCQGDENKLDTVIQAVSELVEGYVAPRYTLPLKNKSLILVDAACDVVRYRLDDVAASETIKNRYEQAVATLDKISKGQIRLNEPDGEEKPTNGQIYVRKQPRKFTSKLLWEDF